MTIRTGCTGLLAALGLVLLPSSCSSTPPADRAERDLAAAVSVAVRAQAVDVSASQATCIVRTTRELGGTAGVEQLDRHRDMVGLTGPGGRGVAQAFEACVGATFADTFGYQP